MEIVAGVVAAGGIIALIATGHVWEGILLLILAIAVGYLYYKRKRGG